MRRIGTFLIIALLSMVFCTGTAVGVTVLVNVYEKAGNLTPVPSALLYANGAPAGKTNSEGWIEFSHPGTENVEILVQKIGYFPWDGEIDVNTTTFNVEMSRRDVPFLIQVYDTDTMAPLEGAHVSIRDTISENTTSTNANGTASFNVTAESVYTVKVEATQYHEFSSQVEVGFDQKTVQALLFRNDRFSILVKEGESGAPLPGANVLVDGVDRGMTDYKGIVALALPREKVYTILVRAEGYEEYNEKQIVGKNQAFITVALKKSPYPIFLSVYDEEKNPIENASILVNGVVKGTTNKFGRLQVTDLILGNYSLEIRNPGYTTLRQPLLITAQGEDIPVEMMYQHVNITVRTLEEGAVPVPGAKIFLNGDEKGVTDERGTLTVSVRLEKHHVISAEKAGYTTVNVEKNVTSFNETGPLVIPMAKSTDWLLVGILSAVGAAVCLGAVILWKRRSSGKMHGRGRGL